MDDLTTLLFPGDSEIPELFYFSLPQKSIQKYETKIPAQKLQLPLAKNPKLSVDKNMCSKWTPDDREQLKKLLLQYGYGRWKQLQRSSTMIGGKLENKSIV